MKKLLLSSMVVASLFAAESNTDVQKEINSLKAQIEKLQKQVNSNKDLAQSAYKKAAPFAANDHLFWKYSLQTNFDFIQYKLQNGKKQTNNILSNRVALDALAQPNENLKGNLRLVAYNIYGMNNGMAQPAYDNSNWTASETPDDTNLRVQEAYFNYFFGDGKFMLSTGRRPSTEGYPANLRDNVRAESPIAHLVNMEFDGFSFWMRNDFFAGLNDKFSDWGTNLKFCFGRGYSSSVGKFGTSTSYAKDTHHITDFGGFLLVPYNDGQYSVWWEQIWAWNMKGYNKSNQFDDLGNFMGSNVIFKAEGIGDGISDFLDDSKTFLSLAYTKTNPKSGKQMLGNSDDKSGWSVWVGADFPTLSDEGNDRWGFNFVHGSKYYRAMTYGEDTLIGSIAATRGNAYEVYYHHYLLDNLTAGLRATYIKYDYTGSNGFFGMGSNPAKVEDTPNAVKSATDIRAYIRYSF